MTIIIDGVEHDAEKLTTAYLVGVCRHTGRTRDQNGLNAAKELKRRGVHHWSLAYWLPGTCHFCDRVGHYRVGQTFLCRHHRDRAPQLANWRWKEQLHAERGADIQRRRKDRDAYEQGKHYIKHTRKTAA